MNPLNVIFDGPPAHESGRFIEVENDQGASVSAGEWIDRGDGTWALRIAPRIITTADELLDLPNDSVVLDAEGDVSQKRGGEWCGYDTAPLNSNRLARLDAPFTVLHEPEVQP